MNIEKINLRQIAIEPMTKVNVAKKEGYFSDPYPIHFAPKIQDSVPLTFSGTTVAEAISDRIRRLIFFAAPVLNDGESARDTFSPDTQSFLEKLQRESNDNTQNIKP